MRKVSSQVLLSLAITAILLMFLAFSQPECKADQGTRISSTQRDQSERNNSNAKYTNEQIESFIKSFDSTPQTSEDLLPQNLNDYAYAVAWQNKRAKGVRGEVDDKWDEWYDSGTISSTKKFKEVLKSKSDGATHYYGLCKNKGKDASQYYKGKIYSRGDAFKITPNGSTQ